jgi:RNA polymerase sigma-70 factor, ECF subfamily
MRNMMCIERLERMGSVHAAMAWPVAAVLVLVASSATVHGRPGALRPRLYGDADDSELLEWAADGDRRAFDEIVKRHGPFALRVASRLVFDAATAEDLVQDAMVRAWSQASHFDPRRARFTTWLYRIVVNLCIDHRRRMKPASLPDGFDVIDPAIGADERMEIDERHAALALALKDLPVRQRAAMTLVYDEGLSGTEAGRVLGLSAKAVERLLARGRATLREHMKTCA